MGVGAPLVVVVAAGVHLERPEASETQRSGGGGPLWYPVAEGVHLSGLWLANPAERWRSGPLVVNVAVGVHLERAEPSETQRSGAGSGGRPLSGQG